MKVLVTGAAGFIGSHLRAYLAERHIPCRAAVRRPDNGIGDAAAVGEINGATDWTSALAGIDTVVHLAARVHVLRDEALDPLAEFRRVNVEGTARLAGQAAAAGVRRFVLMSTIKVLGEETFARPFGPADLPAPVDPYAVSKLEAEEALLRVARDTGMEAVILRPPLVYGKGVGGNFARLVGLVRRGWFLPLGSVRNRRSLVGVENLCSLITVCLVHPAAANQVFLVSDGQDLSTPELIRAIALACGKRPRLLPLPVFLLHLLAKIIGREMEVRRLTGSLWVDSSLTRSLLDWSPPVTVGQEIRRSVH
ncbi:MAG: NAD-dependent epimerase/dehydratase family protein [Desulfobulbaceae bacterium]